MADDGYTVNHAGMDELLNSEMMRGVVERVAERIRDLAVVMSPIGTVFEGDVHPGLYISSWKIRTEMFSGATHDRVCAFVYNDSPDALFVEFGHYGREPYHVLLRAAVGATI
jgi:hypothetical protein